MRIFSRRNNFNDMYVASVELGLKTHTEAMQCGLRCGVIGNPRTGKDGQSGSHDYDE
jgi:hypothetical protein